MVEQEVIGSEIQSTLLFLLMLLLLLSFRPPFSKVSFCFPGEIAAAVELHSEPVLLLLAVVVVVLPADRVPMGCGLARFSFETASGSTGISVGRLGAGAQMSLGRPDGVSPCGGVKGKPAVDMLGIGLHG